MKQIINILAILLLPLSLKAQSTDQNYIQTRSYQTANGVSYLDQIQYFDGLGRPVQSVKKAQTTKDGATWVDLVDCTEYDKIGREYKKWLPVPATGNTGAYVNVANFSVLANNEYGSSEKPYSITEYEASPLNRVLKKQQPGATWEGHPTAMSYQSNEGEVAYFYVNSSNNLQKGDNYAPNTLYKIVTTDEDGKITIQYQNIQGQVVMKQSDTDVQTYYVYNDMGQLSYVLPPLAVDLLTNNGTFDDNTTPALVKYAYLYKYDQRSNCIYKRLPGCDPIYMIYDKADRLVLSQDGNQRAKTPSKQWSVIKYDALGRVAYTGILYRNNSRDELETEIRGQSLIESFDVNNTSFYNTGYTCSGSLTGIMPVTVNYYDSYRFRQMQTAIDTTKLRYVDLAGYDSQYNDNNAKGFLTGTRTYILEQMGRYLVNALYYDHRGSVVQTRSSNQLDGYNFAYNHYDFTGKMLNTRKESNKANYTLVSETYTYTYDPAGRLANTIYQYNDGTPLTLSSNVYDGLGRLTGKLRNNGTDVESYSYNIRNWITKIKSGSFEENLYYNSNLPTGANACFNGNIAASRWTYNANTYTYTYAYDALNRLINACGGEVNGNFEYFNYDKQGNIMSLNRFKVYSPLDFLTMTYDGNQVKSVTDRYGSQNQYAIKEYNDKSNSTVEFSYDKNGNMIKDLDREIVTIRYNLLNLPDTIQFKNGHRITNIYSADGRKLKTEYITLITALNAPITEGTVYNYPFGDLSESASCYIDNLEYASTTNRSGSSYLSKIHNPEGYYAPMASYYTYYRKDHLGNIREVWQANIKRTIQRTQYYPSGLPWAEGSYPSEQPYKFNGKEFIQMHGYDMYDYGARGYFAASGRFTTVDPLAEKFDITVCVLC